MIKLTGKKGKEVGRKKWPNKQIKEETDGYLETTLRYFPVMFASYDKFGRLSLFLSPSSRRRIEKFGRILQYLTWPINQSIVGKHYNRVTAIPWWDILNLRSVSCQENN
jgi:hypothetical protein